MAKMRLKDPRLQGKYNEQPELPSKGDQSTPSTATHFGRDKDGKPLSYRNSTDTPDNGVEVHLPPNGKKLFPAPKKEKENIVAKYSKGTKKMKLKKGC